jgi:hypothetical protein
LRISKKHGGESVNLDLRKSFNKTRGTTTSSNPRMNTKWRIAGRPQAG